MGVPFDLLYKKGVENDQRSRIALDILGWVGESSRRWKNPPNSKVPVFDHIPEVLSWHKISPKKAQLILMEMLGMFSPSDQNQLVIPTIKWVGDYNKILASVSDSGEGNNEQIDKPAYSVRTYALMLYYLKVCEEGTQLTHANRTTVADKIGYEAKNLYNKFRLFHHQSNRLNSLHNETENMKALLRFENVIILLKKHPKALELAKSERNSFLLKL